MLVAQIKTNNRIYSLYSNNIENENIEIYGHYFENNKFYPLNNEIFNEFNKLRLGKNYKKINTVIENNINYDVILDLDTNLKHYFHNGKENTQMFFYNFKPMVIALKENRKELLKWMSFALLSVSTLEFYAYHFVKRNIENVTIGQPTSYNESINISSTSYEETIEQLNDTPEFTIDIIKNFITSNPNLEEYDKSIILNDELLNWAVPYINMNKEYKAELYNYILSNFKIEKGDIDRENIVGTRSYDLLTIDINKIKNNGENKETLYIDTLTHEFVHLLQPFNKYSFIYEGFTEMVSNEFLNHAKDPNNSYANNQKYIKILMEIIGTEPIIEYCFTGNINYIKNELINYLPEKQLDDLIECFKITDDEENFNKVETILKEAFYNKYGIQMEDSLLMSRWHLSLNGYNKINYFNNPTEKLSIVSSSQPIYKTDKVIDENNVEHEVVMQIGAIEEYINDIPKEILLTSRSLEEAKEKLSNNKSK